MNCLVTKIKASVNNNNLPIRDTVRVFVDTSVSASVPQDERCIRVQPDTSAGLKIKAINGFICDSDGSNQVSEKTITGNEQNVYFTSGVTELLVVDKSEIRVFRSYASSAGFNMCTVPLTDLTGLVNASSVALGGTQNSGKVSDFVSGLNPNITTLWLNDTSIEGDIAEFAGLTKLDSFIIPSPNIKGDLESLAVNHIAGNMTFQCGYQCVKYQGEYLGTSFYTVVFDGQGGITSVS